LSKAWGLAGLRVGYAIGPAMVISWMRAAAAPYAVSGPSLSLALAALRAGPSDLESVRQGRDALEAALRAGGLTVVPSQANFVFARSRRAPWLADGLAGLGIAIRTFPDRPELRDAVRIGVPTRRDQIARTCRAIRTVMAPGQVYVEELPESPTPHAWLLTASPARIHTARAAGVLPVGLGAGAALTRLLDAGAARVLPDPSAVKELLP